MNFRHRIRAIYFKELVDILRDRRTLIAMIVVPIVLYPLLMIGSVQAVSVQSKGLQDEKFILLTTTQGQQEKALEWIEEDLAIAAQLRARDVAAGRIDLDTAETEQADLKPFNVDVGYGVTVPEMEEAIRTRQAQLGFEIALDNAQNPMAKQWTVKLHYDPEGIRSATAARRFRDVLERRREFILAGRLDQMRIPPVVVEPVVWEENKVITAGSILGQILPLILVLMTITGAIYPAIDLTAGERERGTLETLMVCPVPVVDLVVGKFLVVTTVAIMGAALNLASVSATVYFGGFAAVIGGAGGEAFPLAALPLILLSLIPFAVLMSAIMIAVCCYARSFKEAQNYVTPVILAVLIPGGIAALPATKLEGVMVVMPVANMVLLTRELLTGSSIGASTVIWVLVSTTMYATAAVVLASKVFGTESVVFSDSASLRSSLSRRLMRPTDRPTLALASMLVALLFPIWFYVQSAVQEGDDYAKALRDTGVLMPVFFAALPLVVCAYFKIDLRRTFSLGRPGVRHVFAAVLLGVSAWVPAHEVMVLVHSVMEVPADLKETDQVLAEALSEMAPWTALLLLAVIPAVSEEVLFRGFLLSGLRATMGKWSAIIVSAVAFAVFHYYVFKLPVPLLLGVLLAYLCWQGRSLWPAVLLHALHNGVQVSMVLWPKLPETLGVQADDSFGHLPASLLAAGGVVFVVGLLLTRQPVALND